MATLSCPRCQTFSCKVRLPDLGHHCRDLLFPAGTAGASRWTQTHALRQLRLRLGRIKRSEGA